MSLRKKFNPITFSEKEIVFQNQEKEKRAAELVVAIKELDFQNTEKEKRAAELIIANKELRYQNEEKEKRAKELIIANEELKFQNQEKEKRAAELVIANQELAFQNEEKEKRAAELIIANKELIFQNEQKEKRAAELVIANKELVFQNDQKEKRAAELVIANNELVFQNAEKEKRAAELIIANIELAFQNAEKEKRDAELVNANTEIAYNIARVAAEKIKTDTAMVESEKKYKHLFEHNPLPMFIWEFDSLQIIDCNKEALVKYGYTKDEFLQLTIRDIRPAEDIMHIEEATKLEEPYGENPVKTWRHRKKSGELMFMKPKGHLVDYHGIKAMLVMLDDITDKLKAEELKEFERRDKEALINNTDDIIWSVGTDFKLIAANIAFIKGLEGMAGITLKPGDELLKPGAFPDDYLIFWEACYRRALAGETFKKEIYTPVIKDGKESWSEISFNPIYKEGTVKDGTIVGCACYSRNITETKLAEKQIKESELRYRSLIEQASDTICISDTTQRFIEMNPSGCQLLGYPREEILRLYMVDILFEEDLELNPLKIEELRSGKTIRNERRLKRKNGTAVDVELSGKMLEDGRILIFISDITERKVVERKLAAATNALQQTLNDLNKIMDSSLDVICAVDAKGNFIRVSAASETVWGYTPQELLGKPLINFVHPDDQEKTQEVASNVMTGNNNNHFENRYIRKDGSSVSIEWTARWDAKDQVRYGVARDTTVKKRLEKAFEAERQRLYDLFAYAPAAMGVLKGPDHVYEIVNPLYLELIGKNDIIGKTVEQVLPEMADQGIIKILDRVYKTGEMFSTKEMHVILNRSENEDPVDKYLNFTYQVYRNIDNKIDGIFFFVIDVTEQVLSRKKIEESEKRYRQIVETAQEGIWLIDENDKTTFVNDKMCEIFGYTKEEMIGKDIYYFMDEDGKNYSLKSMEKKREGYAGKEYVKYLSKTGKEIWANISANPLFNESGAYKGSLAMITDITESREADVRNRFKAELLNTIGQAVMATDLDGKINFWNKAAEKMYGWTTEEAIGKNIIRITPAQQSKEQALELMQELTKGNAWTGEFLVQNKNGISFPVYVTNAPTYDENKKLSGIIGVSTDITERKLSELRLNELNENLLKHTKELAISNAELEQFAYVASHDLQEPLRMVTSFLTQLEKKYGKVIDDRGKKYIDFAVDGAKRMRQIILDLLEYSRVGRKEDKLEDVDLNEVVAEIQGLYRKKISEKNAVLRVGKLPVINSYNAPLRQVFQNLIGNSLKYANKDQPCRIEITVAESNEYWQFTIADNGIGIAREYFDKIFIIFQRLHNKDEFSGTGMGLAVTKKIIENLGGRIWVESEEGKGTAFHFTIKK